MELEWVQKYELSRGEGCDKDRSTPLTHVTKIGAPNKVKKMKKLKHPDIQLYDVLSHFGEFC